MKKWKCVVPYLTGRKHKTGELSGLWPIIQCRVGVLGSLLMQYVLSLPVGHCVRAECHQFQGKFIRSASSYALWDNTLNCLWRCYLSEDRWWIKLNYLSLPAACSSKHHTDCSKDFSMCSLGTTFLQLSWLCGGTNWPRKEKETRLPFVPSSVGTEFLVFSRCPLVIFPVPAPKMMIGLTLCF